MWTVSLELATLAGQFQLFFPHLKQKLQLASQQTTTAHSRPSKQLASSLSTKQQQHINKQQLVDVKSSNICGLFH